MNKRIKKELIKNVVLLLIIVGVVLIFNSIVYGDPTCFVKNCVIVKDEE